MINPADLAACKALLNGGSRSFHAASLLLPRRVAAPATALYAFCRIADDLIDQAGADSGALAQLHARLDAAYSGRPFDHPADRAFAAVVAQHHIPRTLPDALLEGFAWDAANRRYATLAELTDYAARVAGTVGAMMALVMGVRDHHALARAADLGVAMQLTNIARDVGEDARNGRLYLPLDWLAQAGIDADAFLAAPAFSPAIASVTRRLLAEADRLYALGEAGITALPLSCRLGIGAARVIYAEIGRQVERNGGDSIASRAVVSGQRKLELLPRAVGCVAAQAGLRATPPLAATAFLVASVGPLRTTPRPGPIASRAFTLLDLYEKLARRDQLARG